MPRDISKLDPKTQQAIGNFKDPNASIYPYRKGGLQQQDIKLHMMRRQEMRI